jgi:hypothetical protein
MNPNTMTCDECRDELARRKGWTWDASFVWHGTGRGAWVKRGTPTDDTQTIEWTIVHPYPPTLDGAAAAMPEGRSVRVNQEPRHKLTPHWLVNAVDIHEDGGRGYVMIDAEAEDELTARYRLAVACRMARENGTDAADGTDGGGCDPK